MLLGLMLAVVLVHRVAAWLAGRTAEEMFVGDLLFIAGTCGAAGVLLARWWFAGLAAGVVGVVVSLWRPPWTSLTFALVVQFVALNAVIAWSRDVKKDVSAS
jgi:hypothetical protein